MACAAWKVQPKFFKFVVCNPCLSSSSLTILVSLWFIIISVVFFYLSELLFSDFLQFKRGFVRGQNSSRRSGLTHLFADQRVLFNSNYERGRSFLFDLDREWLGEWSGTVHCFNVYSIQRDRDVIILWILKTKGDQCWEVRDEGCGPIPLGPDLKLRNRGSLELFLGRP